MTEDDELMRTDAVAALLKVSPRTLADWRKRGIGPAYAHCPGTRWVRYERSAVLRFKQTRQAS